jgi:hypothetical protein
MTPEHDLCAAILRQAVRDTQSPDARVRQEAQRFWATPEQVAYWDDLLSLNGRLVRHAAATGRATQDIQYEQLMLW